MSQQTKNNNNAFKYQSRNTHKHQIKIINKRKRANKRKTLNQSCAMHGIQPIWFLEIMTWTNFVIEVTPFIHPDLSQACIVMVYDFTGSSGKSVRSGLSKNMPHVWARDNQQCSATHPDLHHVKGHSHDRSPSLFN